MFHGSSCNSLGNVLGLSAGAGVRAELSLVVEVDHSASSGVLQSLLGASHNDLLGTLGLLNLRCLVSDLTITGHRSVLLSHCSKLLVFNNNKGLQSKQILTGIKQSVADSFKSQFTNYESN